MLEDVLHICGSGGIAQVACMQSMLCIRGRHSILSRPRQSSRSLVLQSARDCHSVNGIESMRRGMGTQAQKQTHAYRCSLIAAWACALTLQSTCV